MLPSRSPAIDRGWAIFLALFLGYYFVYGPILQVWKDHWLVKDGQEGVGVVTQEADHGFVVYQYHVGQNVYTGQDHRSLQNPRYANVMRGEKTVVYFSFSHPWISKINLPDFVGIDKLPVMLLVWPLIAGLIVTVINPNSRWALSPSGRRGILETGKAWDSRDENAISAARPAPQFDGWGILKDKLRLLFWGVMIVLTMAVINITINAFFGRK